MLPRVKQACIAFARTAVAIIALSLWALPGHAQQSPFSDMPGSWSGTGNITLSSGSRERIRCNATYALQAGGNDLQLALRCAADSYNFDFRARASHSDGNITGTWDEVVQHAAGTFTGRVDGHHIKTRAEGQTFSALLDLTTTGSRQSILIRSPGSTMSEISIVLTRR